MKRKYLSSQNKLSFEVNQVSTNPNFCCQTKPNVELRKKSYTNKAKKRTRVNYGT